MMARLVTLVLAATFCLGSLAAFGQGASATPLSERSDAWASAAIETLAADGLISGYPDESYRSDRPLTRPEMAALVARAVAKLRAHGAGTTSKADLDTLQRLMRSLKDELILLGVRTTSLDQIVHPAKPAPFSPSLQVHGTTAAEGSAIQLSGVPKTIGGGSIDPFVNAFLSSPADNSPFEHAPGPGNLVRLEAKITPTYTMSETSSVSVPIRVIEYNGPFTAQDRYYVQPAVVLNLGKAGGLSSVYVRAGQLDNLESSRLGLTYRAPDETQQGPGFGNPVQPYENGVAVGGVFNGLTRFQVSWSRIDQSLIDSLPGFGDLVASNNYFLVASPPGNSAIQPGTAGAAGGAPRTDTFVATAGPLGSVSLSIKAAIGSVYISAVNGAVCTPAGTTPAGAPCPIRPGAWRYIDQTNQVVFQSPLPAGSTVQISYSTLNNTSTVGRSSFGFQRDHINARLNQEFKGMPGAELGFSLSRIVDTLDDTSALPSGYGAMSDTVLGLDARLPLPFKLAGKSAVVLFGEGAYSKFTPDSFNTPGITDSAAVGGVRLNLFNATAIVQYQAVGADFMDGAPLRYLGPGPATFQTWHGNFFPQFFGFANNLAINQIFDTSVTPGCAGVACSSRNPGLTYIYPVFNPFVASGPQFYSAFAPNSRGLTTTVAAPFSLGEYALKAHLRVQYLQEIIANGTGQITYGPGFASPVRMKFDTVEGGLSAGLPMFNTRATAELSGSSEHLFRKDMTAYAYVPFNPATGGPDPSSGAALNAFLAGGAIPILFFPNYIDELHTTYSAGLTIPLARELELGLAYNTQSYRGSYGTTIAQNISQRKDGYGGTLSYKIPKTRNSIDLLLGTQRYTDSVLPSYNYNQNREDLNYSIRF
jgi:hypothetical protein